MKKKLTLIIDLTNLAYITRHSRISTPSSGKKELFVKELLIKEIISGIDFYAKFHKADSIVIAGDHKKLWRRDVYPDYKANREHDDVYQEEIKEAIDIVFNFFSDHTNAFTIKAEGAEADDVIAVSKDLLEEDTDIIIISSDKDFCQLIDSRTKLYSPAQSVFRESESPEYDLFLKCVRGDRGDNIFSAYPRVRETVIKEAWEDPLKRINFLESVRADGVKVGDCVEFNSLLMDLRRQPKYVIDNIKDQIILNKNKSKYNEFKIIKFFGDNYLKEFSNMLKDSEHFLKNSPKFQL